jgi:hypothetical protein
VAETESACSCEGEVIWNASATSPCAAKEVEIGQTETGLTRIGRQMEICRTEICRAEIWVYSKTKLTKCSWVGIYQNLSGMHLRKWACAT